MIKGKDVVVHFSKEANEAYTQLQEKVANQRKQGTQNSSDMQLLKSIDREKENLKRDPQSGIHIPRANIPKQAVQRYGTDKLWKINLAGYWRMIYTITGNDVEIITFVLEIIDHKDYDKVFGYKKK